MGHALQAHPSKEVAARPLTTRLSKKIRHESENQLVVGTSLAIDADDEVREVG